MNSHYIDWDATRPASGLRHRVVVVPSPEVAVTRNLDSNSSSSDSRNHTSSNDHIHPSTYVMAILLIAIVFVGIPLSVTLYRWFKNNRCGQHDCLSVFFGRTANPVTTDQATSQSGPQNGTHASSAPAEQQRQHNDSNHVHASEDCKKIQQELVTRQYDREDEEVQEVGDCPICLSPFQAGDEVAQAVNPDCCHKFHTECIVKWLIKHPDCPQCRRDFFHSSRPSNS